MQPKWLVSLKANEVAGMSWVLNLKTTREAMDNVFKYTRVHIYLLGTYQIKILVNNFSRAGGKAKFFQFSLKLDICIHDWSNNHRKGFGAE
jgi:hypothetical protein